MEHSLRKTGFRRLFVLVGIGLVLLVIGIAWRLIATDTIAQWRAEKMPDEALAKVAAEANPPVPFVLEWAKRLEAGSHAAEAERVYSRACELAPSRSDAWIGFGRTAILAGDWGKAELVLAKTVEQWPDSADAHFTYATVLSSTFRFRKAIEQLKAGLKYSPNRGEAFQTLGDLELREGDSAAAAEAYAQAAKLMPKAKGLHGRYGAALVSTGKYEQAQKELDSALKEDPSDMNARFNLGKALANSKSDQEHIHALQELNRVVQFSENKSRAYVEAAHIWLNEGDRSNAIQALEHAFDMNPMNIDMLNLLIKAYQEDGRPVEADRTRKALERAKTLTDRRNAVLSRLDEGQDVVNNLLLLGQVDLNGTNVNEARMAFQAARCLDPGNVEAARLLQTMAKKSSQ